jgi:hypothetical protein
MIHHMSFGVRDPSRVARVLAGLTGASAIRAPSPPFPYGAWFVVAGDDRGSLLELLPASTVLAPDAPLGVRQRASGVHPGNAHVLVRATVDSAAIEAVAAAEGWPMQEVETGLFRVVKLWIDGVTLIEFLTGEEIGRYVDAFGARGVASLDDRLRGMEAELAPALTAKLPPSVLTDALGHPPE